MNYYIKKNFGKLTEIDDEVLDLGYNAFKSIDEFLANVYPNGDDNIVLLDSKTTLKYAELEGCNFYSNKIVDFYDFKATGSFQLTKSYVNNIFNFKDVSIVESTAGYIWGGEQIEIERKNSETEEIKSVGKIQIKDSEITAIKGFATVTVEDSSIETIHALNSSYNEYDLEYRIGYEKDEEKGSIGINDDETVISGTETNSEIEKSNGSITIKDSSIGGSILGFAKHTISDSEIQGDISSYGNCSEKETWTYKTNKSGEILANYTSVESFTSTATLTATNSLLSSICVNTVNLTNSSAGNISNDLCVKWNDKYTYSVYDDVWTAYNLMYPWDADFDRYEYMVTSDCTSDFKATGSVTIKIDKNCFENIFIGSIKNFKKIDISGFEEYYVDVVEYIKTDYHNSSYKENRSKEIYSYTDEFKASGSVTLKNNVHANSILNYEKVNISDGYISGSIYSYDYFNGDEYDYMYSRRNIDWQCGEYEFLGYEGYLKIQENYLADGSVNITKERKALGTVTLKDTIVDGSIVGFLTVSITDSQVNEVHGVNNIKYTYSSNAKGEYENVVIKNTCKFTAVNSSIYSEITKFSTVNLTNSNAYYGVRGFGGNFTFNITKYATSDNYTIGLIDDFDNVKISGYTDAKKGVYIGVFSGSIYGNKKAEIKNNIFIEGQVCGFDNVTIINSYVSESVSCINEADYENEYNEYNIVAKGTATISNSKVGSILGYKTLKVTDSDVRGSIDGYNTKGSSATLTTIDLQGDCGGYQKLTLSKECNLDYIYGTSFDDVLTINKGAVVELYGLNLDEGKDKLVLNGTIIAKEGVDFSDIEVISGNGVIVGNRYVIENCKKWDDCKVKASLLDLGDTTEGFKGKDVELADNTEKKAVKANWEYNSDGVCTLDGWLGKNVDIEDTVDYIKFTAEFDGYVEVHGLGYNDLINVNGRKFDCGHGFYFYATAGEDYKLGIIRKEDDSTHYTVVMSKDC